MFGFFSKAVWTFTSNLPASTVVANLDREIRRRNFIGRASAGEVVVKLNGMPPHKPYQPTFRGHISDASFGCTLSGTVTYPLSLRLFTALFLEFRVFWTITAYFATRGDDEAKWMPLAGLLCTAVGVGFFKLLEIFTKRLAEGLESEIKNALARVA